MAYDAKKFEELVLYVAAAMIDDPTAGAVKLNKALYYAEFGHVRAHGRSITGAEYQRLPMGPAPRRLPPVRRRLIDRGDARLDRTTFRGYEQDRLVPLREADPTVLSEEERRSADEAVAELEGMTGTAVSERSHDEVGWQMVAEGETIPFSTAYLRTPVVTARVRAHGEQLAHELGLR